MKSLTILSVLCLLILGSGPGSSVHAQAPTPVLIGGTVSISSELRADIEAYIAASPPSVAAYYAPTYVQNEGPFTLISLAGINIQSPGDPWYIEGTDDQPSNVIWIGTVRINMDGSGSLHSTPMTSSRHLPKLAMPIFPGPGGGTYVRLPFQIGRAMQYGVRGIHGAGDFGTSGMRAVDLVGGTGLGSNVASSTVYASYTGTVDFVCADDLQTAIRTYNAATDDYFLYAHLYDNASLELDHVFQAGSVIGSLRPGTYTDDCGWTEQGENIYHIHWMFKPSGGAFTVGRYKILQSDGKFHSGNNVYATGSWITNTSTPSGADDPVPGQPGGAPSFWDTVVGGIVRAAGEIADQLPRPPPEVMHAIHVANNTTNLFFRLAWVLLRPNLNLTFFAWCVGAGITMRLIVSIPWAVMWVVRVLRIIKQTFNPHG